ncbi:MAG TPA: hypothetical protein VFH70_07775 [Acidimicrobiales bacterium]|nr:hypothetical protein [Acidimicrobiales bacterium]
MSAADELWMRQGVCTKLADWESADPDDQITACLHCPVRAECLAWVDEQEAHLAKTTAERLPVYGGLPGPDRVRRRREAAAPRAAR